MPQGLLSYTHQSCSPAWTRVLKLTDKWVPLLYLYGWSLAILYGLQPFKTASTARRLPQRSSSSSSCTSLPKRGAKCAICTSTLRRQLEHRPLSTFHILFNMMSPTFTNIRVRTTRDAEIIFHAVRLGSYPWLSNALVVMNEWPYVPAVCTYGKNVAAAFPSLWNRALSVSQKEEVGDPRGIVVPHDVYVKYPADETKSDNL